MNKPSNIVIIGSGLGALVCGVILSRKGYRITILEKNNQIGGLTQSFRRGNHEFSTGLHYLGSLDDGQTLNKIFKYLNLFDGISYKKLDETGFDVFNIGGSEYRFPMGLENFRNQMCQYFPDEIETIDRYISEIRDALEAQDIYHLRPNTKTLHQPHKCLTTNTWDFVCSLTENNELRNVLTASNFVYAGEKESSPLYVHALINNHFIASSYRIIGSTSKIANKLAEQIVLMGGSILTNKTVNKVITEDEEVIGVSTEDGSKYLCDKVISNIHPARTVDLFNDGDCNRSFIKRMKRRKNTISAFAVHLVLKDNSFKYRNYNYNYYKKNDSWYASSYDEKKWPEHFFLHCSFPKDGNNYISTVGLLTHMKFEEVEKWMDIPKTKRGNDYAEFKKQKADKLIKLAIEQFPELEGNIIDYYVSTPLTYYSWLGTPEGSMYGTIRDFRNPIGSYISPTTKFNNLFFTGQNINLHGIIGVSLSALLTCGEFIDLEEILKEINEQ